jgi:hypothetical protein
MVYAHAGVTADPGPRKVSPRQQGMVVIDTAGSEDGGARFAGPELGAGRLLERSQAAGVIVVRVRVQEHFYVFGVESQLRDALQRSRKVRWVRRNGVGAITVSALRC